MNQALTIHSFPNASGAKQIDASLLKYASSDAALYVVAGTILKDDRIDPLQSEKLGEQQPCWSSADDGDLRAHWESSS